MNDNNLIMRILTATADDNCEDIWWRIDGKYAPITIFVNCNDLFSWASSDHEKITNENIDILEQSYKDSKDHGAQLFCCRIRNMRPQGAYYAYIEKNERHLFDVCGPEREINFGNPVTPDEGEGYLK